MHRTQRIAVIIFAVVLVVMHGVVAESVRSADHERVLVVSTSWKATFLDPAQSRSTGDGRIRWMLYDQLVGYAPGSFSIVPMLAESWEISEDGMVYTFKLREDVTFHDGTRFDAHAVKINIDRQIDPSHPYHREGLMTWRVVRLGAVESVHVVDDFTVEFRLKYPSSALLDNLATAAGSMVSPRALEKWGTTEEIGFNPVGTGPFILEEWDYNTGRVVMRANDNYWGGKPGVDRLIYLYYPDPLSEIAALESGTVDIIWDLPLDYVQYMKSRGYHVVEYPTTGVWIVQMDTRIPPFDDVKVRQAMNYAVDREAVIQAINGGGTPATGPAAPVFPEYTDDVPRYEYNPAKAKELLNEAGYPNGFSVTLAIPESGPGQQDPKAIATVIQANLAEIGVDVKIETYEWAMYEQKRTAGELPFAARGFVPAGIQSVFPVNFHSGEIPPKGRNTTYYSNPDVDLWIEQALAEPDLERRLEIYAKLQRQLVEDAPWLFVHFMKGYVAYRDGITGVEPHPTGFHPFHLVRMR